MSDIYPRIVAFLERTGMPETRFGRAVVKDPRLVWDMRERGRVLRPSMEAKIRAFLDDFGDLKLDLSPDKPIRLYPTHNDPDFVPAKHVPVRDGVEASKEFGSPCPFCGVHPRILCEHRARLIDPVMVAALMAPRRPPMPKGTRVVPRSCFSRIDRLILSGIERRPVRGFLLRLHPVVQRA